MQCDSVAAVLQGAFQNQVFWAARLRARLCIFTFQLVQLSEQPDFHAVSLGDSRLGLAHAISRTVAYPEGGRNDGEEYHGLGRGIAPPTQLSSVSVQWLLGHEQMRNLALQ
jgi:hypothetical protein